jgi:hypothetical protein
MYMYILLHEYVLNHTPSRGSKGSTCRGPHRLVHSTHTPAAIAAAGAVDSQARLRCLCPLPVQVRPQCCEPPVTHTATVPSPTTALSDMLVYALFYRPLLCYALLCCAVLCCAVLCKKWLLLMLHCIHMHSCLCTDRAQAPPSPPSPHGGPFLRSTSCAVCRGDATKFFKNQITEQVCVYVQGALICDVSLMCALWTVAHVVRGF